MNITGHTFTRFATRRPRLVIGAMLLSTLVLIAGAALPIFWAPAAKVLPLLTIDTDPENMLSADEPARVFHNANKKEFGLYDILVVGVVNETHPDGVFNVDTLGRVYALTEFARDLPSVVASEVIAPSTVDDIESSGAGVVRFDWLMPGPPKTREAALRVRERAMRIPFLKDTMVSGDGQAVALYLPLKSKDQAHDVSLALEAKVAEIGAGTDQIHITGLPVAEDTFGYEMFVQMALSAPAAMLVIFLLLWVFFRKLVVIASPMILAMVAALGTMSALVVTGNTVHIMSSMIPIFIMPIAVLDAVHIISDFFDRYAPGVDRKDTVHGVMAELFRPMLFTSLTTTAGFASLALTPIPPVQVFGVFVGFGVLLAWFWTVMFIPAFLVSIPDRWLSGFGLKVGAEGTPLSERLLRQVSALTAAAPRAVIAATVVVLGIAGYGISLINVNDNPIKWFQPSHPIRVADKVLNAHFAGTYEAYLTLQTEQRSYEAGAYAAELKALGRKHESATRAAFTALAKSVDALVKVAPEQDAVALMDAVDGQARKRAKLATSPQDTAAASAVADFLDEQFAIAEEHEGPSAAYVVALSEASKARVGALSASLTALGGHVDAVAAQSPASREAFRAAVTKALPAGSSASAQLLAIAAQSGQVFKDPAMLAYLDKLQLALTESPVVGKTNSLVDIVKTVHRDLLGGAQADYRIPARPQIVAQTLQQYQSSHRKDDLWHFVTPDYTKTLIWVQLKSGDNQDMQKVLRTAEAFFAANPPPDGLAAPRWSGLTYINEVWQQKMVRGMMEAFGGSFLVVLLMMIVLFRSILWGLLSMIPLTVTVSVIYGLTGLLGKDYDMPVAVLSSLSLGLAIDYAIHFLARSANLVTIHGSWEAARVHVFGEPARAISRNIIVVGMGFLPLLLATLVPYQTVGLLIASILLLAGAATLIILPALIIVLERWLFPKRPEQARAAVGSNGATA